MNEIIDLRNKRNALWEQTKAFLEEHRGENGLVAANAVEQYDRMVADVKALGDEIKRLEDQIPSVILVLTTITSSTGSVRLPLT